MIDPKDVIARLSIDELVQTADEYYRRIDDATPLMVKPFSTLHEAPQMVENLGLLLAGLHLGKTMTVLDFGAGTCWLSRFLAQLNCQPVCCDTSKAALAIGERVFKALPLLGTAVYQPRFLWFDGHHLDLPDQSVDRIVCFDAFHHVPNQREVLAELGRVLAHGGIAGFSEPGRQHSASPQAQYEMRNHRVLENDIRLREIFDLAQPAGFTDMRMTVVNDCMSISLTEYETLFSTDAKREKDRETLKSEVWNQTFNGMFNRSIFFLHKGKMRRDSRSHVGLAHRAGAAVKAVTARAGVPFDLDLTFENVGEARWLHFNSEIFGIVRIGSHLYDSQGALVSIDFTRDWLAYSVEPGNMLRQRVTLTISEPGSYRLGLDLVAEGVSWFENLGSVPVEIDVTVDPHDNSAISVSR